MPHECTNCGRTFPDGSKEMLSGCPECGGRKFKFEPATRTTRQAADELPATENAEASSSSGFVDHAVEAAEAAPDRGETTRDTGSTVGSDDTAAATDTTAADETAASTGTATTDETTASEEPLTSREWPDHPDVADSVTDDQSQQPSSSVDDQQSTSEASNTSTEERGTQSGTRPHAGVDPGDGFEDSAQADARSAVVSESELPDHDAGRGDTPGDTTASGADTVGAGDPTAEGDAADEPPVTDQRRFEALREELNEQFESIRIVRPGEYELNLVELYDREEFIVSLREDGRYVIEMPDAWESPDD